MVSRIDAKQTAKENLQGKWGKVGVTYLLVYTVLIIAVMVLQIIPVVGDIAPYFFQAAFMLGMIRVALKVARKDPVEVEDGFSGLDYFWKAVGVYFWQMLWIMLWTLLFVVPGLIKAYSYRMAFYALANNPELGIREALNESKQLMEGHKMDVFITDLSFIGWHIVCFLTVGIGYFWLEPYRQVTFAAMYVQMRGEVSES